MARSKSGPTKDTFEDKIKNALNMILRREVSDPRLNLVSVTRVELNQDFSVAKVYWDTYDNSSRGDIKKAFDSAAGKLRSILAKNVQFRHTPSLNFYYDSQFEDELKITKLLDETKS
ncbi:MAG: 30S ribosome-binding factor RbfA [Bacteriovoracaceae bacterium]|jgi:ribosome-binding factor A|nr:30S ribosome-binding factor RbfA [Bacteriovoracaceae bacterium]